MMEGGPRSSNTEQPLEQQSGYRQLRVIRDTLASSERGRTPHLSTKDELRLLDTGFELLVAFYGTSAGWFGRHTRIQLAESFDESKGKDLIMFIRTAKSGEEFVVAADVTAGVHTIDPKIKGEKGVVSKNASGRVRLSGLNELMADPLSPLYESNQSKGPLVERYRKSEKAQNISSVPQIVLAISRETLKKILSDPTMSQKEFERHPVQLRLLEQTIVQVGYIRNQRTARINQRHEGATIEMLNRLLQALKDIYAERYRIINPEKREEFSSDPNHKRVLHLITGDKVSDTLNSLKQYAEQCAGEVVPTGNPWPLTRTNGE